ncbi:MAG TPA: hypothetical protein PLU22_09840, partial [Polyangiaceae bacterium]|nr:hypothetical protein [Polyangiaceae bacterium]
MIADGLPVGRAHGGCPAVALARGPEERAWFEAARVLVGHPLRRIPRRHPRSSRCVGPGRRGSLRATAVRCHASCARGGMTNQHPPPELPHHRLVAYHVAVELLLA